MFRNLSGGRIVRGHRRFTKVAPVAIGNFVRSACLRSSFFTLAILLLSSTAHAQAQPAPPVPQPETTRDGPVDEEMMEEDDGESIVVTGQRLRGAVDTDIPPEYQLDRRDIRAYGAGSVTELLDALAPLTRSGRGRGGEGRPVVLLNGRRISGFREIRDLPPEAIERVDVLPEEVALQYGYRADQRVVNFVLRRRFDAVTAELEGGLATDGGRETFETDLNYLNITRAGRFSLDAEYQRSSALFESERDLIQLNPDPLFDASQFRTLLPQTDALSLGGTINRTVLGDVSATGNFRFDLNDSTSFFGVPDDADPQDDPDALRRERRSRTGGVGLALNGDVRPWRWSLTSNYDRARTVTLTDRDVAASARPRDRARTTSDTANAELVANGPVFDLPAGDVSSSIRIGGSYLGLDGVTQRAAFVQGRNLSRTRGNAQLNLDVPIARRSRNVLAAIGDLSLNFNAEVEELSDFGTLRTLGAGLSWEPLEDVNLIASFTDEDGAPTIAQLGDPPIETPNARVFDFTRGQTVDVTRIEGGNPNLLADNRRVFKLGVTVRPLEKADLALSANYNNERVRDVIASFPVATAEIEAAFPDRFQRDASGRLRRIDSRPVNFERADREELRYGFNFSLPWGPQGPSPAERRAFRERFRAQGGEVGGGQGRRPDRAGPGGGGRGGFGGGRGGFGGGGRNSGRIQFGLFHTWRLQDEILIRGGVPVLDLLGGSAVGNRGGRPEHEVEITGGLFRNGFGARLAANYQSGTTVRGPGLGDDLRFGEFLTANLRLFADLNAQRSLVRRHRWLRGTRISLNIDNIFNSRLDVRDEAGLVPIGYQPALLDPLGRSVTLSIRKLFF
jgi:hypothetical protein